jgi:hypothetical protein
LESVSEVLSLASDGFKVLQIEQTKLKDRIALLLEQELKRPETKNNIKVVPKNDNSRRDE